ncbi:MAG: DUF4937 domain-containing protein [Phycisphaerales bacterium]|nr:DUF4937 domain-containing protein [Phycisphaerales bacterium]
MYLKWIVCEVEAASCGAFHRAQLGWRRIRSAEGFVAQVGGWTQDRREACVLGLWEDKASCDRFMASLHDEIVNETHQDLTYLSCRVMHAASVMRMGGEAATLREAIRGAVVLRVADCEVRADRIPHFLDVQRNVWEPAMASAAGQLGGVFSRSATSPSRYLVTTFWRAAESHAEYVRNRVPTLRAAASVDEDVDTLAGRVVQLEGAWRVISG